MRWLREKRPIEGEEKFSPGHFPTGFAASRLPTPGDWVPPDARGGDKDKEAPWKKKPKSLEGKCLRRRPGVMGYVDSEGKLGRVKNPEHRQPHDPRILQRTARRRTRYKKRKNGVKSPDGTMED